ncbi:MAG: HPF/RaiA family ribosome-associated protein [Cyclobacteriaceae bacterium]
MIIQINTGKHVSVSQESRTWYESVLTEELSRFEDQITRIEVHLTDETGSRDGQNDKRCLLEARLEGLQPIVATNNADSHEEATIGAAEKMKATLTTRLGKLRTF